MRTSVDHHRPDDSARAEPGRDHRARRPAGQARDLSAQIIAARSIASPASHHGVKVTDVSNLLAKLGVTGRAEAVAVAHRRGLLAG